MLRKLLPILIRALGIGGFVALKATRPKPDPVVPQERVWQDWGSRIGPVSATAA